jgi:hypothetical protein
MQWYHHYGLILISQGRFCMTVGAFYHQDVGFEVFSADSFIHSFINGSTALCWTLAAFLVS